VFDRDESCDLLVVTDWGQRLAFYQLSGKQVSHKIYIQSLASVMCKKKSQNRRTFINTFVCQKSGIKSKQMYHHTIQPGLERVQACTR